MNIRRVLLTGCRSALLIAIASILISCGGSGDSSTDTTSVDTTTAVNNTAKTIMGVLDTNATAVSSVTVDSAALASILEAEGITLSDTSSTGLTNDFGDFLNTSLDVNTAEISRNGITITVSPSVTAFCDVYATKEGIAKDDLLYTQCQDILADVRLLIEVTGAETGTLSLSYKGSTPLQVQYSPTRLTVTVNLADSIAALQSLMAVIDPNAVFDTPETVEGVVAVDMQVLGAQHVSTSLRITQAIKLQDIAAGIDVNIASATLFSAEADGIAGTASVSSSLNAITGSFPVDIDKSDGVDEVPGDLSLAAATMTLAITDGGNGLTGNVSVGPLNIKLNNTEAVNFVLDPQFSIDPNTGVITLDSDLYLDLSVTDTSPPFFDMNGTLTISAPTGTAFAEVGTTGAVYQVKSGYITFAASGDVFSGPPGTVTEGECFNIDGPVACPLN